MGIESSIIDNVLIIKINSELLNEIENNEFDSFQKENLERGIKKIVIDITEVNYFNSSHIGLVVRLFSSAKEYNVVLKVGGSSDRIASLLDTVKLSSVVKVYPTVVEAINSF